MPTLENIIDFYNRLVPASPASGAHVDAIVTQGTLSRGDPTHYKVEIRIGSTVVAVGVGEDIQKAVLSIQKALLDRGVIDSGNNIFASQ